MFFTWKCLQIKSVRVNISAAAKVNVVECWMSAALHGVSLLDVTIGAFTLVKTVIFKFTVFCLTIYTCQKKPELSAGTKLRDFLDRYCACPNISYFSFDWECLQLCVCVYVCVCVCACVWVFVCVRVMCVCLPLYVFAHLCVSNTNVLV